MSNIKEKLIRLNKIAAKRPAEPEAEDSTIEEPPIDEETHHEEVIETTEEFEDPDVLEEQDDDEDDDDGLVEFEQGETERGAVALWHEGIFKEVSCGFIWFDY